MPPPPHPLFLWRNGRSPPWSQLSDCDIPKWSLQKHAIELPLEDGGDDRDDGRGGDEAEGKLDNPLGRLPIFNKFLVKFLGVCDGFFDIG